MNDHVTSPLLNQAMCGREATAKELLEMQSKNLVNKADGLNKLASEVECLSPRAQSELRNLIIASQRH